MKVIFLDFDGVINTTRKNGSGFDLILPIVNKRHRYSGSTYCDPLVLPFFTLMIKLCCKYNVKIVISSTWRMGIEVKEFNNFFNTFFNFPKRFYKNKENIVIGRTKSFGERGLEILDYIKENKEIKEFVSIDDDAKYDITKHIGEKHSVEVDRNIGLTLENIKQAFNKLKIDLSKDDDFLELLKIYK